MSSNSFEVPNNMMVPGQLAQSSFSEPDLFRKMIQFSIAFHIAIVLIFGVKAAIFPQRSIDLDAAIKVDMVGLPDKVAELPQPPQAAPAPALPPPPVAPPAPPVAKVQPVKPVPVALTPASKAKTLEKIRKMQREERERKVLENIKAEVAQEEAKAARQAKLNQLLKGNAVSQGSALHGLNRTQFNEYMGALQNHVHQHWNLPEWLQNDNLKASVIVYIDYRGVVLKRGLVRSSGDSRFDDYVLRAVDEASPFPQPPSKFVDIVRLEGIVLGFPQ